MTQQLSRLKAAVRAAILLTFFVALPVATYWPWGHGQHGHSFLRIIAVFFQSLAQYWPATLTASLVLCSLAFALKRRSKGAFVGATIVTFVSAVFLTWPYHYLFRRWIYVFFARQ